MEEKDAFVVLPRLRTMPRRWSQNPTLAHAEAEAPGRTARALQRRVSEPAALASGA